MKIVKSLRAIKWNAIFILVLFNISILAIYPADAFQTASLAIFLTVAGYIVRDSFKKQPQWLANSVLGFGVFIAFFSIFYNFVFSSGWLSNPALGWLVAGFAGQAMLVSFGQFYQGSSSNALIRISETLFTLSWAIIGVSSLLEADFIILHEYRLIFIMGIWSLVTFAKYQKVTLNVTAPENNSVRNELIGKALTVVFIGFFLGFGMYHLGQFMSVDEPKWVENRVPQLYTALSRGDWASTYINDKPGILPAALAGIVNLFLVEDEFEAFPLIYENYLFLWRLPILLFNAVLIYIIYILLSKLFGLKVAVVTTSLISINPVLIGISQVVNPDSTQWTTAFVSILAFFLYLKHNQPKYWILSAVSLGVSLSSKYFASILFLIFTGTIFLEHLSSRGTSVEELKRRILDMLKLTAVSIVTFTILFPATWITPRLIFNGTIGSNLLGPGLPFFYIFVGIMLFFIMIVKEKKYQKIIRNTRLEATLGLLLSLLIVTIFIVLYLNILQGNKIFDFNQYKYVESVRRGINYSGDILTSSYTTLLTLPLPVLTGIIIMPVYFLKRIFEKNTTKSYLYDDILLTSSLIFVIVFIVGAALGGFTAVVRYQIMLYPLYILLASLVLNKLFHKSNVVNSLVIGGALYALITTIPFYYQYTNVLNHNDYVVSDAWGFGGYEIAKHLNDLPNSEDITVWSDREGVINFFNGNFEWRGRTNPFDENLEIDYLILTTGGERIFRRALREYNAGRRYLYAVVAGETPLLSYYEDDTYFHKVCINDNPNDCIRIVEVKKENINQ